MLCSSSQMHVMHAFQCVSTDSAPKPDSTCIPASLLGHLCVSSSSAWLVVHLSVQACCASLQMAALRPLTHKTTIDTTHIIIVIIIIIILFLGGGGSICYT